MKAFVVDKYKKKGALCLVNMPEPKLRDSDVLVRIQATSVNPLDSKVRDGEFKLLLPYRPPFVLGHDVAGTVVRTGPKVRQFKMGDTVYARPRDHRVGTFAEFIAIDEADVALKPKNLDMAEAASVQRCSCGHLQAPSGDSKLFAVGTTAAVRRTEFAAVCGGVVSHSGTEPNA